MDKYHDAIYNFIFRMIHDREQVEDLTQEAFIKAFASWMNIPFDEHGLVFLSSNDPRLKRLLSPLFTKEIAELPATSQLGI